jgi:hypothetical protein
LIGTFYSRSLKGALSQFLSGAALLINPFYIVELVLFMTSDRENFTREFLAGTGIIVSSILGSVFMNNAFYHNFRCAGIVREAVMSAGYERA